MSDSLRKTRLILIAIAALLVVIVVLQNTDSVETNVLFLKLEMPRAALLFGTLVIGFAMGVLTAGRLLRNKNE